MSDIKVSICCQAYNHEHYIRQCLDGFMLQKCDFIFEVLIHDDASKDKTASIIKEYETKYPGIVKPIYQSENQFSKGVKPTFAFNIPRVKGQYIAMCEGDDYWIDPLKLQKQVDFLEQNKEYSLCFHDANFLYTNKSIKKFSQKYSFLQSRSDYTRKDLFKYKWFIPTASVVFRNQSMDLSYFRNIYSGDSTLYLLLSKIGKFKYLSDCMSVYRITNQGVGTIVNKPEYRLNDLRKWLLLVEPYEKKFIYRAICGRHKLLLFSSIKSKSFLLIIASIKNILLAFLNYIYFSFTYYFYTKKTTF
ncbi:MAG: glycosyltransferase family 2 protein [Flavobacterium sp.]|uniref:glycosyltransferase family 2 protein n=1 Tax=Flavobacterium sp. TaxID=239 RepID=UPI003BE2FEEB